MCLVQSEIVSYCLLTEEIIILNNLLNRTSNKVLFELKTKCMFVQQMSVSQRLEGQCVCTLK